MVKEFSGFRKVAERKLTMLDNASDLKRPAFASGKPSGEAERRSSRTAQHQDQRSVADLLCLEG